MDHAIRMVVIPEEVYLSLVNQNKKLMNPLDSHILESSNRLNEILHDPNLDDSSKFKLYTNELKQMQKIKTNRDEIPMNVNIKNMESNTIEDLSKAISEKMPIHSSDKPKDEAFTSPDPNETITSRNFVPPYTDETPKTTSLTKREKRKLRDQRNGDFEKLRNYLNDNRAKFGIREDGKIFKDSSKKGVYSYSNYEIISKALTGLTPRRPHGLRHLLDAIKKDDYAKNLILSFNETPQEGTGKVQKVQRVKRSAPIKYPKKNANKKVRFCPEIWT